MSSILIILHTKKPSTFPIYFNCDKISGCFCRYDNFLKEYTRYLPFGLAIASSFLQTLHGTEPLDFNPVRVEETIRQVFDKGGDVVNAELRSIIIDIYRLHDKLNLTLEKL